MKIFISGSIGIKSLSETELSYIDEFIEGKHTFLIGDAHGLDKFVQEYLSEQNYKDVIVYFSGEKMRNNKGNWNMKQCLNPENLTGRSFYQLKDNEIADDCDCGMMFWNGKSKGTKHNIAYMEKLDKHSRCVLQNIN